MSQGEGVNLLSYRDAGNISDYAIPAFRWACGAGIMNGDNLGSLNPQNTATRAEAVAMLQRFIKRSIS
ncbi:MAG: S-layer homology domain-containing protein [Clostridiales bacterium]|nr:S-layer homology domain-containing protein [Clostridiales bacterium]